jgi:hypothetical protein
MSVFDFLKRKSDTSSEAIPAPASGSFVKEFILRRESEFDAFQNQFNNSGGSSVDSSFVFDIASMSSFPSGL